MSDTHTKPAEYMVARIGGTVLLNADPMTQWLNDRAAEGWRLISVSDGVCFFERSPVVANARDRTRK